MSNIISKTNLVKRLAGIAFCALLLSFSTAPAGGEGFEIYLNNKGVFIETDIANSTGLWQTLYITDVNGDGFSEVIVGSYLYDNFYTDEGCTLVYPGSIVDHKLMRPV
jgi:hypothetical protein